MVVKDIIGYGLAGLGLLGIVASSDKIRPLIPIIKNLPVKYLVLGAGILVIAGVAVILASSSSQRVKQAEEEVPIYQGEGRNKKIVGYKRAK